MPLYNYRAVDAYGKAVTSSLSARDFAEAKRKIQENELVVVKITRGSDIKEKIDKIFTKKINTKVISLFCRQLFIIISSGVNILNGLDILRNQTKNKVMKSVVGKLYSEVQKGRSLSEAMNDMENMLPPLLVNMVSVGEVSGNLDEILQRMSLYYEKEGYMRDKLKSAMTYPVILISVGIVMLIFFINFVLPEIVKLITESGGQLPALTRGVIGTANFLKNYGILVIAAIAGLIILARTAVPREKFRLAKDKLINKLPVASNSIRNVVTSRFLRTISMMLKGGIPLIRVLESMEKVMGNAIAEIGIRAALEGVKRGERLGDNIASCNYFDSIVIHMINIGEETGELDNILEAMADYYDKEAETSLMKMMAMVEPVFTILVGVFIGILIVSMMIPMFGMLSQISNQ